MHAPAVHCGSSSPSFAYLSNASRGCKKKGIVSIVSGSVLAVVNNDATAEHLMAPKSSSAETRAAGIPRPINAQLPRCPFLLAVLAAQCGGPSKHSAAVTLHRSSNHPARSARGRADPILVPSDAAIARQGPPAHSPSQSGRPQPSHPSAGAKAKNTRSGSLTSSSRVVSRTKFCTTCCVALAPTRPPRPGPVTGSSGLLLLRGSIRSFSRFRFVPRAISPSLNIGNA